MHNAAQAPAFDARLSVVVPVRDEEDSIEPLVAEIDAALAGRDLDFEIVYVDDGSRDGTALALALDAPWWLWRCRCWPGPWRAWWPARGLQPGMCARVYG
jgi:hypothetical protein